MPPRRVVTVTKRSLREEEHEEEAYAHLTPEARIGMMWQLAQDCWALMGAPSAESRLSRRVVRVQRRGG